MNYRQKLIKTFLSTWFLDAPLLKAYQYRKERHFAHMLHLNNGQEQQLLLQTTSQFKPTLQKWAQLWRRPSGTALKVVGIRNLTYYILSYSTFIYQHKIEHGWNLRLKVSFIIRTYFFIEIHPCPRNRLTKKVIFITEYVVVVKMNSVHAGPLFTFIFR